MAPSDLILRTNRQEDFSSLLELYNSAREEAPHFVRDSRLLEYFMKYKGAEDGIFVATEQEKFVGLAIVSLTEEPDFRHGEIVELQAKDTATMESLLQSAEKYCRDKAVDLVTVVPPLISGADNILKGWLKFETGAMMCQSLNLQALLKALLDREELRSTFAGKRFLFRIGNEEIIAKIYSDSVEIAVSKEAPHKSTIVLSMSKHVFLELTLKGFSPYQALITGKIRVKKPKDVPAVLKMLRIIKVKQPWSLMLVDRV